MAEQQKYWIKLLNRNDGYLYQWTSRDGITSTYIGNSWHEDTDTTGRTKQKFTKEEVLALDERYWQFAIPVMKTIEKYWVVNPATGRFLGFDRVSKRVWWLTDQNNGARAELTEDEIRAIDESYLNFKVLVQ